MKHPLTSRPLDAYSFALSCPRCGGQLCEQVSSAPHRRYRAAALCCESCRCHLLLQVRLLEEPRDGAMR